MGKNGTLKLYWGGDVGMYPNGMRQLVVTDFIIHVDGTLSFVDSDKDKRVVGNVPFEFIESKDQPIPPPTQYVSPFAEWGI